MTKNEESLQQQQILFSENDKSFELNNDHVSDKESHRSDQVIFENDDYLPLVGSENGLDEIRKDELEPLQRNANQSNSRGRSWLWIIIAIAFGTLITIETVDFFMTGFNNSPVITSLYGILLAALSAVTLKTILHECVGLRQFKKRQKMKDLATELILIDAEGMTEKSNKRGKQFCENISASLPCDLVFDSAKELDVWHEALASEYNSSEVVQLYSRVILTKVDEKALNEVAKFSTEAVVLVALSPVAIIDMLIMLSRNLRMINKIAGLYGLQLGYWSRIKLIKQVFVNMAYAGASELVADYGSDVLGAELLGKLSARFAQGLGAGMLTARLGAKTMELCRPIPFKEKPKLTHVRNKIAQQIRSLLSSTR